MTEKQQQSAQKTLTFMSSDWVLSATEVSRLSTNVGAELLG